MEKYVAKDLLPNECGGKAGTIEEIKTYWLKKTVENRLVFKYFYLHLRLGLELRKCR